MEGYKKIIALSLLLSLGMSSAHAQWQWLTTLKSFAAPLINHLQEYPKLTAAFTVLSLLGIHSMQYAYEHYRAEKKTSKDLAALRTLSERKESLGLQAQLIKEKTALDQELATLSKTDTLLAERIARNQAKINAAHAAAQKKKSLRQMLPAIQEENARNLIPQIQQLTQERDQLHEQEKAIQERFAMVQHNPLVIAQAQKNAAIALAIKNRPKTDVDEVLKNAQILQNLLSKELAAQQQLSHYQTTLDDVMLAREQLASIIERANANIEKYFLEKYSLQMCEPINSNPYELYKNLGMTESEGILLTYDQMQKLITDPKHSKNIRLNLSRIFCARQTIYNPLAKENYDAFLIGEKALAALMPTEEQYTNARELDEQLEQKMFALHAKIRSIKDEELLKKMLLRDQKKSGMNSQGVSYASKK